MYTDKCIPAIGDKFQVEIKEKDSHDRYAVAVKVDGGGEGWSLKSGINFMGDYGTSRVFVNLVLTSTLHIHCTCDNTVS